MTIVKELNELAKKMTGVNPGAKTDAQALNYIEQHYEGGDTPTPQSKFDYVIDWGGTISSASSEVEIVDSNVIAVLDDIKENANPESPLNIGLIYESAYETNVKKFNPLNVMSYTDDGFGELSFYTETGEVHIYNKGTSYTYYTN